MVTLGRTSAAEGSTFTGTVTRNGSTSGALVVALSSQDTTEAQVPQTITILAGQSSANFLVTAIDDGQNDGAQSTRIDASASGYSVGSATVVVTDVNLPDLTVTAVTAPATIASGASLPLTYRVENHGTAATGTWDDRLILSTDTSVSDDDQVLGTYTFSGTLAGGQGYSRSISAFAPLTLGSRYVIVVTDEGNQVTELDDSNNSTLSSPLSVTPAYAATVSTTVHSAVAGTVIPLQGHATLLAGGVAAGKLVNVHVVSRGVERIVSALTDAAGNFTATFRPLADEAGNYTLAATYPGVAASGGTQDAFTLSGIKAVATDASLQITPGTTSAPHTLTVRNLGESSLTGISLSASGLPAGVTALFSGAASTLASDGVMSVTYTLTAAANAATGTSTFTLSATSTGGAVSVASVALVVVPVGPKLVLASTSPISVGALRGAQRFAEVEIRNDGSGPSGPLTLALPSASWIAATSGAAIPSLDPGASFTVELQLTPPSNLPLGSVDTHLTVSNASTALSVPLHFDIVSSAIGAAKVTISSELTYYAVGAPHVAGATVIVRDSLTKTTIATVLTDASGSVLIPNLTEGYYDFSISADHFSAVTQTALVRAGSATTVDIFTSRQTVTYTFSVVPTSVADVTTVSLITTFETDVPLPVVTFDPGLIDVSDLLPGDTRTINMIATNHGLIAAPDVKLNLPSIPGFSISSIGTTLGDLPPNSSITVPVVITRLAARASSDAASTVCDATIDLSFPLKCGGATINFGIDAQIHLSGNCPTGSSSTGGGGGGGPGIRWGVGWRPRSHHRSHRTRRGVGTIDQLRSLFGVTAKARP